MTGARGLEAAIQAKQLAPETPLVWWSDDKNFALIAYQLRIPAFLSIDCSDQELYEAMEPIRKRRYGNANCAMQLESEGERNGVTDEAWQSRPL